MSVFFAFFVVKPPFSPLLPVNFWGEDSSFYGGMVAGEMKRRGWNGEQLGLRRKGDGAKVALARRWREETTMTLKWMAKRPATGRKR